MFRSQRRKSRQVEAEVKENKQWAKEYILDPLTAPEPSQECGPGSTFIAPSRRSLEQSARELYLLEDRSLNIQQRYPSTRSTSKRSTRSSYSPLPSPSPSRFSFEDVVSPCTESRYPNEPAQRPQLLSHSSSTATFRSRSDSNTKHHRSQKHSPPPPTHQSRSFGKYPPRTSVTRSHSANQLPGNRDALFPKEPSAPPSPMEGLKPSFSRSNSVSTPSEVTGRPRRRSSLSQRFPGDMSHRPLDMIRRENKIADKASHLRIPPVPNDKPELDSQNPFTDSKHSKKSSKKGFTDTIDRLDHTAVGGAYHHGGPYDAALASRNTNPKYAPLEAVKDSNSEALKATPRDYVIDSITRHVPLQGTATMPPGLPHPRTGEVLNYEEGADLMRDSNAGGGAYKRWPGVQYLDEDLKGKGEPSYTIEKHLKDAKRIQRNQSYPPQARGSDNSIYEMQTSGSSSAVRRSGSMRTSSRKQGMPAVAVRRRRNSSAADRDSSRRNWSGNTGNGCAREGGDMSSSSTTDRREQNGGSSSKGGFGKGLKRRFGSLRRKE